MNNFKEKDIILAKVTGIQEYGAFVNIDDEHNGLIHISEISYGYVKNINDFVKIGDKIYAEVINIDKDSNQLRLSIKDIDYKKDGTRLKRIAETKSGFEPLKENLDNWINQKFKEIIEKYEND